MVWNLLGECWACALLGEMSPGLIACYTVCALALLAPAMVRAATSGELVVIFMDQHFRVHQRQCAHSDGAAERR